MPELPEVETVRRHLHAILPGHRIDRIELRRTALRYPIPVGAVQALAGHTVLSVRRRAKYLLIDLDGADAQSVALVHLGMSGRLFAAAQPDHGTQAFERHEHWRLGLNAVADSAVRLDLRYVDARRFGALDVFAAAAEPSHPLLAALGPEPLEAGFCGAYMYAGTRGLRSAVKSWLMDGHRVVGIGNIYASEACWRAGVHPLGPAGDLDAARCDALVGAAQSVLRDAIAAGGSTLRDFVGGDSAPGYFQQSLDVYDRGGEPCTRCAKATGSSARPGSAVIERTVLANRATYFCAACQS